VGDLGPSVQEQSSQDASGAIAEGTRRALRSNGRLAEYWTRAILIMFKMGSEWSMATAVERTSAMITPSGHSRLGIIPAVIGVAITIYIAPVRCVGWTFARNSGSASACRTSTALDLGSGSQCGRGDALLAWMRSQLRSARCAWP